MEEFLSSPAGAIIEALALFAVAIAVGIYIIGKVRGRLGEDELPTSQMLTNFQELHQRGGLSDQEYRTIKSMLAERLQNELNSTDQSG